MAQLLRNIPINNVSNLDRSWKIYGEELELFLTASGITNDNQKRAVLLHISGKQVRAIFNTFSNVGTSYQNACDRLDEYLKWLKFRVDLISRSTKIFDFAWI